MNRLIACLIALGGVLLLAGCQQDLGVTRVLGTYYRWMPYSVPQVMAAAERAATEDLGGTVTLRRVSDETGRLIVRNRQDNEIIISADREPGGRSKVSVTVRPGEPESYSLLVLDRIEEHLGTIRTGTR